MDGKTCLAVLPQTVACLLFISWFLALSSTIVALKRNTGLEGALFWIGTAIIVTLVALNPVDPSMYDTCNGIIFL